MTHFNNEQITEKLADLPGWKHDGKATLNGIRKVFNFKDFKEAWVFMDKVAKLSDAADHHPEWSNVYNRVEIMLTTHSAGGVSEKDIALATAIEEVLSSS